AAGRLWRGTPYQELVADPEASLEADRLRELYLTVRTDQAEALVRAGRPAQAAVLLREVTARDPLREHAWALLVRSLHHAGRRGEAEATYRRARSTLLAELGVEPGPELAAAREVSAEPDPYELAAASGVDVASVKRVLACLQRRVHGPSAWRVAGWRVRAARRARRCRFSGAPRRGPPRTRPPPAWPRRAGRSSCSPTPTRPVRSPPCARSKRHRCAGACAAASSCRTGHGCAPRCPSGSSSSAQHVPRYAPPRKYRPMRWWSTPWWHCSRPSRARPGWPRSGSAGWSPRSPTCSNESGRRPHR